MKDEPLSEDLVRHMVLNSLRSYKTKFSKDFGDLVLCYDDKHCWRKDYFPYYKQNRKKARSESSLDWNELFDILTKNNLMTADEFYKLSENYQLTQAGKQSDGIAHVKLFNATGAGTWFISEMSAEDGHSFGKAHIFELGYGYTSVLELLDVHMEAKMFLSKDLHWTPRPLKEITLDDVYPSYEEVEMYSNV